MDRNHGKHGLLQGSHDSPESHSSHGGASHFCSMTRSWSWPVAVCESHAGHALTQAALFDEFLLQCLELLVDEVVRLMNETDRDVGDDLGRAGLHELAIEFVCLR